jgi:hypothetical protein
MTRLLAVLYFPARIYFALDPSRAKMKNRNFFGERYKNMIVKKKNRIISTVPFSIEPA